MKIPRYWAKREQGVTAKDGRALNLAIWQWSDTSVEEATQRADTRLLELTLKVASGAELNRYGYGERPLREEIIQAVAGGGGNEVGVVTRNIYGALVLNAQNAMFIDIDFPENTTPKKLFGPKPASLQDATMQRIEGWAAQRPELGMRVYRTYGGVRCLVTSATFDPSRADATEVLTALGSDPLYMRLCKAQECFRARLTPKPWRCDLSTPPASFPWADARAEGEFRQWQQEYEQASAKRAVCTFIKQVGPAAVHPDVAPVLNMHDSMTKAVSGLPLA